MNIDVFGLTRPTNLNTIVSNTTNCFSKMAAKMSDSQKKSGVPSEIVNYNITKASGVVFRVSFHSFIN